MHARASHTLRPGLSNNESVEDEVTLRRIKVQTEYSGADSIKEIVINFTPSAPMLLGQCFHKRGNKLVNGILCLLTPVVDDFVPRNAE